MRLFTKATIATAITAGTLFGGSAIAEPSASATEPPPINAWWGYGGCNCHKQGDETVSGSYYPPGIEPSPFWPSLTLVYADDATRRLVFLQGLGV